MLRRPPTRPISAIGRVAAQQLGQRRAQHQGEQAEVGVVERPAQPGDQEHHPLVAGDLAYPAHIWPVVVPLRGMRSSLPSLSIDLRACSPGSGGAMSLARSLTVADGFGQFFARAAGLNPQSNPPSVQMRSLSAIAARHPVRITARSNR